DFFFQLPYDTLAVGKPLDGVVLIAFLTTATVTTHLLAAERARAAEAERLAAERTRLVAEADRAEALREADRLKDVVLASVSHDLRTPLTTIKMLAVEGARRAEPRALGEGLALVLAVAVRGGGIVLPVRWRMFVLLYLTGGAAA